MVLFKLGLKESSILNQFFSFLLKTKQKDWLLLIEKNTDHPSKKMIAIWLVFPYFGYFASPSSSSAAKNGDLAALQARIAELELANKKNEQDLEKISDEHKCPICMEIVMIPVTPKTVWKPDERKSCGHIFCLKCLRSWWDAQKQQHRPLNCPKCRAPIHKQGSLGFAKMMTVLEKHHFVRYDALHARKSPKGFDCQNSCGKKFKTCDAYWQHLRETCPESPIPCTGPTKRDGCRYRVISKRSEMISGRCLRCSQTAAAMKYRNLNCERQNKNADVERMEERMDRLQREINGLKESRDKFLKYIENDLEPGMVSIRFKYDELTLRLRDAGFGEGTPLEPPPRPPLQPPSWFF